MQITKMAVVFLLALIVMSVVLAFWPSDTNVTIHAQSNRTSNSNAARPQTPVIDDFSPEFSNLPTFAEIAETRNDERGKLIEVAEFLRSDMQWPSYSRSAIDVQNGEKWLGLFVVKGKLRLIETELTRSAREGFVGPGDQPEDWLKFQKKGNLVFLTKGVSGLNKGGVITLYSKSLSFESVYMENGFRRVFTLAGTEYTLRVTTGLQRDGGKVNVLVLESQGKSQIVTFNLYYKDHNTLYNSIGELLWVGDMDGDGRLDLYFSDYGFEKGGFGSNLHLSSPAQGEDLVERVAGFSSAGC